VNSDLILRKVIENLDVMKSAERRFQSIFFHIPLELQSEIQELDTEGNETLWDTIYDILENQGILWCCINNNVKPTGLDILSLQLAAQLQTLGFHTRNIIVWYNNEYSCCSNRLSNRYTFVLFVTKHAEDYKFFIDKIREPHIWKDYEWGGGRKDRYHPLGKNPSNFWLKTISRKGKTINHVPLTWEEMVARCLKSCTEPDDTVLGIVPRNRDFGEVSKELNLRTKLVSLPPETGIHFQKKPWEAAQELARKGEGQSSPRIFYKSSESMDEIKSGEIQTIVTSPPYWGLRDYGIRNQIGFNESYQEYLGRLETVWAECHRILNDRGVLWININKRVVKGRILLFPVDIIKSCLKIGFKLQDIVIWFRAISVPSAGQENFTDRYEYIMMLTKTDKFKFYRNRLKSRDFFNEKEFDLINVWKLFRKIGNLSEDINAKTKIAVKHTAMFPEELVRRAVVLSSDEGDVVLDPFLGSGTTVAVAKSLRRTGVGYEINEAFKPLIKAKLKDDGQSLSKFL
jgi:site-specific DNA-methyltransferase (adenine-specific)